MKSTHDRADVYRTRTLTPIKAPLVNKSGASSSVIKPSGDGRSRGGRK